MKNVKKILSILAVSPLFVAGLVAGTSGRLAETVNAKTMYAYQNDGSKAFGNIAAVDEGSEGNKAFQIGGNAQANTGGLGLALSFDTEYTVSLKAKGAEGQKLQTGLLLTLGPDYSEYPNLWSSIITMDGSWKDISFVVGFKQVEGKIALYNGGFAAEPTITTKEHASVANVNVLLNVTEGADPMFVDDFKISFEPAKPEYNIDYTNAVYFNGYEEGLTVGTLFGAGELKGDAYDGEKALLKSGLGGSDWYGDTIGPSTPGFNASWLGDGNFYRFSAIVRAEDEDNTRTGSPYVQLQTWVCDAQDDQAGWAALGRYTLINYSRYGTYNSWTEVHSDLCFYNSPDGSSYVMATEEDGYSELVKESKVGAGLIVGPQYRLDMAGTNGTPLLYDNVAIYPITKTKDATLTVSGLTGVSLEVWKDGAKLAAQPEITEAAGVFTIKDLVYSNCAEEYELKVIVGGEIVDSRNVSYIKPSALVAQYDATITVVDEAGEPITDATLTAGELVVTENVEGVYSFNGLRDLLEVEISKEGFISQKVTLTDQNTAVNIVLRQPKPISEYVDNLMPNAGVEGPWTLNDESHGATTPVVTDLDSCEGKQSLMITSNAEGAQAIYRVADGPAFTEKEYRIEAMVKAANAQTTQMNIGAFHTCSATSGWSYITAAGNWTTISENEWTLVSMTYKVRVDSVASKAYYSVNGGEEAEIDGVISSAAMDIRFGFAHAGDAVLIDDIAIFELFDAEVVVVKDDGSLDKEATFTITDNRGKSLTPNVAFNEQKQAYVLTGMYSEMSIVARSGEQTFKAVKVNKDLAENQIEISKDYKITITLVADTGEFVTGAIVKAIKGLVEVGTFTEVGNGVYELEGVMGDVQITVNKTGYDFDKKLVTSSTATLTMTGTNLNPPAPEPEPESGKKGCGGSVIAASALISTVALLGAGLIASKKRED